MKTIPLLLFMGFTMCAYSECLLICRTYFDPDFGILEKCELRCDDTNPDIPDNNPEPTPDPHTCGTQGSIGNLRVEMYDPVCFGNCGSVFNPTTGRWQNAFRFSGGVIRTFGASARVVLSYSRSPNSVDQKTFYGPVFNTSVGTYSSDRDSSFNWEIVAELSCNGTWDEIDRESGSADLKTNGDDFDRTLISSNVLLNTEHILRVNTCAGGFHIITQTHTRAHTFELNGTVLKDRIQAKYGWGDTTSISQGTRINLPNHKCDIELDTLVDTYDINSFHYDWLGLPTTPIYSGRVLIKKLQISTPTFGICN